MKDQIICGDCLQLLPTIETDSIDLIVTSPPYFNQRDYGRGENEFSSIETYLDFLTSVFRECHRVTKATGSIVFNVGDKYIDGSLALVPYQFAFRVLKTFPVKLVNDISWIKPNPPPRQFNQRLVNAREPLFHVVKSGNYFYNPDEYLKSENSSTKHSRPTHKKGQSYIEKIKLSKNLMPNEKRNAIRDIKKVLAEIKTGSIADFRVKIRGIHAGAYGGTSGGRATQIKQNGYTIIKIFNNQLKPDVITCPVNSSTLPGWKDPTRPATYPPKLVEEIIYLLAPPAGLVLDPFMGVGNTAIACINTGRHYIGFELNEYYCEYANKYTKLHSHIIPPKTVKITDFIKKSRSHNK